MPFKFNPITGKLDVVNQAAESNTASNLGAGVGVFEGKLGTDLQFNSLVSQNNLLTISEDDANDEINFTVNEAALTITESQISAFIDTDTYANILDSAPSNNVFRYATDTQQLCFYDGTNWYVMSSYANTDVAEPNMGVEQEENREDYGKDYIANKALSQCEVGGYTNTPIKEGGIRRVFATSLNKYVFQIYLNGEWQTLLSGINIQTDETETPPDIEITNLSTIFSLSLITGDSDITDSTGLPVVQQMKTSIGAHQVPQIVNRGTF